MRRLTASQKIAVLERRIAKLEKQALVTEFISDLLNKIKNIPVNLVKRIFQCIKRCRVFSGASRGQVLQ